MLMRGEGQELTAAFDKGFHPDHVQMLKIDIDSLSAVFKYASTISRHLFEFRDQLLFEPSKQYGSGICGQSLVYVLFPRFASL